ncbi:MAG: hypothetical protein KJ858_02330 [Nanoarchaeota archaeon]|nr:hypothetical protein [Nanoarchaeota archaeon]
MKNCLFCGKELEKENIDTCKTCLGFLEWKHKNRFSKRLSKFRELLKRDRKFNKIKLGREK